MRMLGLACCVLLLVLGCRTNEPARVPYEEARRSAIRFCELIEPGDSAKCPDRFTDTFTNRMVMDIAFRAANDCLVSGFKVRESLYYACMKSRSADLRDAEFDRMDREAYRRRVLQWQIWNASR